jgi:ankyrin repeat protein
MFGSILFIVGMAALAVLFVHHARRNDIHACAAAGNLSAVRALLDAAPERVDQRDSNGETPLHHAVRRGQYEVMRMLAKRGADVNARSEGDVAPIHVAAIAGHAQAVDWMLERGVAIECPDEAGATPLHYAAHGGQEEVITLLLERGADPQLRDGDGLSAADVAWGAGRIALAEQLERAVVARTAGWR